MYKGILTVVWVLMGCALSACGQTDYKSESVQTTLSQSQQIPEESKQNNEPIESETGERQEEITMFYAHIGSTVLEIIPAENSSAVAFMELLKLSDITIDMHDYGSFEKVGSLGNLLPTNDENITTEPGDVILYQGNSIVIYYDTNTYKFTRLGKVQGISQSELKSILGDENVTVIFSLYE